VNDHQMSSAGRWYNWRSLVTHAVSIQDRVDARRRELDDMTSAAAADMKLHNVLGDGRRIRRPAPGETRRR